MIVTTYCTAQSLILQLISSDELVSDGVIKVTFGAGGRRPIHSTCISDNDSQDSQ